MSKVRAESFDQGQHFDITNNNDFENDDLVKFQHGSKTIYFFYSQLTKYSKHIRDAYLFSDVINRFPQDIRNFQEEHQLLSESVDYFFQLLNKNFNIGEDLILTYNQCIDLLKISQFLKVRKLSFNINQYIKSRNIDTDFVIQMIEYETKTQKEMDNHDIEISNEVEILLIDKINECFTNEKFKNLPIEIIYRIIKQCSPDSIDNDKLFDIIVSSLSKFCVLFQFLNLQKISDDRLEQLCEMYSISNENTKHYYDYLNCDLNLINEIKDRKKNLEKMNVEQQKLKPFQSKQIPPPPQNAPTHPSPSKAQTQIIPFLDPFSEEYKSLKSALEDITFRQDEIEKSIIAGCAEVNECSTYIENIRNNQPNNTTLTYSGFNIDDLSPPQRAIYDTYSETDENGESVIDTVQVLYILLYTGVEDDDEFISYYYNKAINNETIPLKQSNIDLELQRILGLTAPPQESFSNEDLKKEYDEAKKRLEEELKYKRKALELIKRQKGTQNCEFESQSIASNNQFSKTDPINIKQATQSSPKTAGNSKTALIRFQLPNGTTTDLEFETTNTFNDIERKLKEDNHINESDIIEFNIVPFTRVARSDFSLQLQDKHIRGKAVMLVKIIQQQPPPPPQEDSKNTQDTNASTAQNTIFSDANTPTAKYLKEFENLKLMKKLKIIKRVSSENIEESYNKYK